MLRNRLMHFVTFILIELTEKAEWSCDENEKKKPKARLIRLQSKWIKWKRKKAILIALQLVIKLCVVIRVWVSSVYRYEFSVSYYWAPFESITF